MSRIDRIRRAALVRRAQKAEAEPAESAGDPGLPIPVSPSGGTRTFRDDRAHGEAELAAHVMGQHGERRGLRAGEPVLNAARDAYNRTEWSGSYDRRARKGRQARTSI